MQSILVIEDDPDISEVIRINLETCGFSVDCFSDGQAGATAACSGKYDLIVMDLVLPSMDGLEICRQVRKHNPLIPIIMLTSKDTELDRVVGLEVGADDYITKPFSVRELEARIKAAFRRVNSYQSAQEGGKTQDQIIEYGDLKLSTSKRRVLVKGEEVSLTTKEFDLLMHMAQHPGQVFSREDLLESVWGYTHKGYEHTVNSHVNRLRQKIEPDPSNPIYVQTVWGAGYRFSDA